MKGIILVLTLLAGIAVAGQEVPHAPTAEQCKADATVWFNQHLVTPTVDDALSFRELSAREKEMADCLDVLEPSSTDRRHAYEVGTSYGLMIGKREANFLKRHNLIRQFEKEDANGAR
jgi:hypothetical protein